MKEPGLSPKRLSQRLHWCLHHVLVFLCGTLHSEILGQERKYAIYLPPGYHTSTRSYPVLYLLHGAGDDHTGWVQFGEVQHIADRQIAAGEATPMIIVMPEVEESAIESHFKRHSAVELARSLPKKDLASVRWYIDCGDDDFLYEGNALVHIEMRKREIDHEYRVRDGGHRWSYWRSALPNVLQFVSAAFHQH